MSRVLDATDISVERGPFEMIPHWLIDAEVSSHAIRLYVILRRHGNDRGVCFPGRRRLANQLKMSASTVDRARAELAEVGAICYRTRLGVDSEYTSNEYHVHWQTTTTCVFFDKGYPAGEHTPPAGEHTPISTGDELTKTHKEPKQTEQDGFEQFWLVYPRKQNKGRARTAFTKALTKASLDEILQGAQRYRDDPNRTDEFTAHASSWLNGERWTDDPLPMRGQSRARQQTEIATFAANFIPLQTEPTALESATSRGEITA